MCVCGGCKTERVALFSFQLLSFDDNEMRLVSRSLRRRNQARPGKEGLCHVHKWVDSKRAGIE